MFEVCPGCGKQILPRRCPHCGAMVDGHTDVGREKCHPDPDDVCICLYCSGVAIYTKHSLRMPTDEESVEIMANEEVQKAFWAIRRMRDEGNIPPCG